MCIIKLHDSDDYILHAQVTFGHACDRNINGTGNAYKQHLFNGENLRTIQPSFRKNLIIG